MQINAKYTSISNTCEILSITFFEQNIMKSKYIKIINLIRLMLSIQRLATCCLESQSPSYIYLPSTSILYVALLCHLPSSILHLYVIYPPLCCTSVIYPPHVVPVFHSPHTSHLSQSV